MEPKPKKLLDQVRDTIRLKHYSIHTEEAYVNWIKRYILSHNKQPPSEMGAPEVEAFLCPSSGAPPRRTCPMPWRTNPPRSIREEERRHGVPCPMASHPHG